MINVTDALTVKIKLKLSQLIDVVRSDTSFAKSAPRLRNNINITIDIYIPKNQEGAYAVLFFFAESEESDHDNEPLGRTGNVLIKKIN